MSTVRRTDRQCDCGRFGVYSQCLISRPTDKASHHSRAVENYSLDRGDDIPGGASLAGDAWVMSSFADGERLAVAHCAPTIATTIIRMSKTRQRIARELNPAPPAVNCSPDPDDERAPRGRSAISLAATVSGSSGASDEISSPAIKDVTRRFAAAFGIRASSAASRQGSISSRANAERTLSSIPFFSSPIGAIRNASNSDPRVNFFKGCVISTTGYPRLP